MECERLIRLVKSWYIQVQEESLAPARMVEFMESHLKKCETCDQDPLVRREVEKIVKLLLPQSKLQKPAEEEPDDPVPQSPTVDSGVETGEEEDKYVDDDEDSDESGDDKADDEEEEDPLDDIDL